MTSETDEHADTPAGSHPAPERRAHPCVQGPFDAVRLGLLEFKLRIYDLSAGGCLIDTHTQISPERPIHLRIALPDGESVTVRGMVARPAHNVGYAVRFVDLDESTREAIERALEYVRLERSQN